MCCFVVESGAAVLYSPIGWMWKLAVSRVLGLRNINKAARIKTAYCKSFLNAIYIQYDCVNSPRSEFIPCTLMWIVSKALCSLLIVIFILWEIHICKCVNWSNCLCKLDETLFFSKLNWDLNWFCPEISLYFCLSFSYFKLTCVHNVKCFLNAWFN